MNTTNVYFDWHTSMYIFNYLNVMLAEITPHRIRASTVSIVADGSGLDSKLAVD